MGQPLVVIESRGLGDHGEGNARSKENRKSTSHGNSRSRRPWRREVKQWRGHERDKPLKTARNGVDKVLDEARHAHLGEGLDHERVRPFWLQVMKAKQLFMKADRP